MRIAYICADPGVPVFGNKGSSIHVQEMVRAMLVRGAEVELFVARTGGTPPADLQHCLVHEMSIQGRDDTRKREVEQIRWNQRVGRALGNRPRFDLVYERYALWSVQALLWAKNKGIPSVLEVNAPLIDEQANHRELVQAHLVGVFTRQAMRNAGTTYVVSDAIVPYCRQFLPHRQPVRVIANGVNTVRFSPTTAAMDPFPGFTVGFIGSLKPWHGVDQLIEAYAQFSRSVPWNPSLVQRRIPSRLLIVGDGPQRSAIEKQLQTHSELRDTVKLVGAVDAQSVPGWLNSMDVAVAPYPDLSDFYFSPLKLYEYMAAGRVVLGSATGQINELVQHGVNGWLYPPGDVAAMANALIELWQDGSLCRRLGRAARQTAVGHGWDQVLDQVLTAAEQDQLLSVKQGGLRDELEI